MIVTVKIDVQNLQQLCTLAQAAMTATLNDIAAQVNAQVAEAQAAQQQQVNEQ